MAHADNPTEIIKSTQMALIASMRDILGHIKKDTGAPGITWDQLEFLLKQFEQKEPTIIYQEHDQ